MVVDASNTMEESLVAAKEPVWTKQLPLLASTLFLVGSILLVLDVWIGQAVNHLLTSGFVVLALHAVVELVLDVKTRRVYAHTRYARVQGALQSQSNFHWIMNTIQSATFILACLLQVAAFQVMYTIKNNFDDNSNSLNIFLALSLGAACVFVMTSVMLVMSRRCFCLSCFSSCISVCDSVASSLYVLATVMELLASLSDLRDYNQSFLGYYLHHLVYILLFICGILFLIVDMNHKFIRQPQLDLEEPPLPYITTSKSGSDAS